MSAAAVFVVDDDQGVRESLQALLESRGYRVAGFESAEAFLASQAPRQTGCALIDLRMAGMDGIALLERLREMGSRMPVIVVTGHGDVPLAVRAMRAGASDFIEKPYSSEAIVEGVRRALSTQPAEAGAVGEVAHRVAGLTPRERDVLERLVIGHANKIIAYELNISPRTVEIHRANLMKKMQADSLSHLVRMALAAGIGG